MKNIIIGSLSVLLLASLGAVFFVLQDLVLAQPKYSSIAWSKADISILNRGYAELGKDSRVPVGYYPYEIQEHDGGTTIRFRSFDFLRLRKSTLLDEEILDGCVLVHFDKSMKLQEVQYCG